MTTELQVGIGLIFVGLVGLAAYLWSIWKTAKLTTSFLVRWFPALAESDKFFALIEHAAGRSHFFERHGPVLNLEDIVERSKNGNITFSGVRGKPVSSSRWLTHKDLLLAIESALDHWAKGVRPKGGSFNFEFEHPIGEGFSKDQQELVRTRFARVIVNKGLVVTAFPVLEPNEAFRSLAGSLGHPPWAAGCPLIIGVKGRQLVIRPAKLTDSARIAATHQASIEALCSENYSPQSIAAWVAALSPDIYASAINEKVMIVAEDKGEILGLGILDLERKEISAVYVHPRVKGKGVGRQLLLELEGIASKHGVAELTLCATLNAADFYSHFGYISNGATFHELPNGFRLECIRMQKPLDESGDTRAAHVPT